MRGDQSGQAAVEAVLLMPLLVLVVAGAVQVLAAGSAREDANAAAEAGAVAMLQDADPRQAVHDALGDAAGRADFVIDGHHVRVTVRPRAFAEPLAQLLAATAEADAGEEGDAARRIVVRGGDGESSRPGDRKS
jgi:hypothetical protein